jgi:adsorption protein B
MNLFVYITGLLIALCYVLLSIDDVIWDIAHAFRRRKDTTGEKLRIGDLDALPPKLLAVMIAAWHEDSVLEPVVDNMIASIQYPRSMYHIFLGVYPNDPETIRVAERLSGKYENVHVAVNTRPGPTCKADNINSILRNIRDFEEARGWRFFSVTVHDSEDVVHPYELKVTNYLIDQFDSLQFPVFPLQRMPTWKNFFKNITTGTYADEFAENHYRTMGMRDSMSAVVPSAGTGFVISRKIIDAFGDTPLFPEDSLTEDYKLSLTFAKLGYKVHYVLEKVQRLTDKYKLKWDYIATRSIFPATYKTAVRQKTRWIYGITMQSLRLSDIFAPGRVSLAGRYTLYKDLKSKIGNLVVLPGYVIFIYAVVSYFVTLPVMYPMYTLSWWLCVVLTGMMVFRQTLRAAAIKNVYGFRSVFFSCLLPPLMPVRLVWGNIINMSATLRAWKQLFFGIRKSNRNKKVAWAKTDHEFIDDTVLRGYRRKLGDVLLEKDFIDPNVLKRMLNISREKKLRLGDVLLEHQAVTEDQLAVALAHTQHMIYVKSLASFGNRLTKNFDWKELWDACFCPILSAPGKVVYAVTVYTPPSVYDEIMASDCGIVYTTKLEVQLFLTRLRSKRNGGQFKVIHEKLMMRSISWEQAVIALDNADDRSDILSYMGLSKTGCTDIIQTDDLEIRA